jgi:hypothetical protein
MGRRALVIVLCGLSLLATVDAIAQTRCDNRDGINCVFDPKSNQWIIQGSGPVATQPRPAPEAPPAMRFDPEAHARARAGELGPPDQALANDLYRLGCAVGDGDSVCDKVAAADKAQAALEPTPPPGRDKSAGAPTQARAKDSRTAASQARR